MAVAAKKHIFLEKPVAVGPAGVRRLLAATKQESGREKLFCRRHNKLSSRISRSTSLWLRSTPRRSSSAVIRRYR